MFLKDLCVFDPASKMEPNSAEAVIRIGRAIPKLLTDAEIDRIRYEYIMYTDETIDESWYIKNEYPDSDGNRQIEYHRVDYYWNKVLSLTTNFGVPKYPILAKILQNTLILSHGNSDVRRVFNVGEPMLTEHRTSLSTSSINGLRSTWDAIKFFGSGSPHLVSIRNDMVSAAQKSKSLYYQEQLSLKAIAERERKENEIYENTNEEIKKLTDQENQLLFKQKSLQDEQKKAQVLVAEGRQRLDNALKKADLLDAQVANAIIGTGDEKVKSILDDLIDVTDELTIIQSRRENLFFQIQSFKNKRPKMLTGASDRI